MVTLNKKQAIRSAKEHVLGFLEQDADVCGTGAFYEYPGEEAFILEVLVPDDQSLGLLQRIEPLLNEIADNNDFSIILFLSHSHRLWLPQPPSSTPQRTRPSTTAP
jgi:hypothetical protein